MNIYTLITFLAWPLVSSGPAPSEPTGMSGAVFALIDNNEWCPGGSVYVDLHTGDFMLHPRPARRHCEDINAIAIVEKGTLGSEDIRLLREAVTSAIDGGLRREECAFILDNGGPNHLAITVPGFSDATPDQPGCWSDEAAKLHDELFRLFG